MRKRTAPARQEAPRGTSLRSWVGISLNLKSRESAQLTSEVFADDADPLALLVRRDR
jgi:hypothetical protein